MFSGVGAVFNAMDGARVDSYSRPHISGGCQPIQPTWCAVIRSSQCFVSAFMSACVSCLFCYCALVQAILALRDQIHQ